MTSLLTSKELTEQLEIYLPNCSHLNVISAFVTSPAIEWLQSHVSQAGVCIVGRFSPSDFTDGASDFNALEKALEKGWQIRLLPNLHAKIYQIDNDIIFTGSANMTGKGLALVDGSNLEACTKVATSDASKDFIQKIIEASFWLTSDTLKNMQLFIDDVVGCDIGDTPKNWPEDIIPQIIDIFVSDFPFTKPGNSHPIYQVNPSLEFAIIEANRSDFNIAKALFRNSKAYCWLKDLLIRHEANRDLGFGQISAHLHDALSDDPAPYRKEIKDIQAHLYEYISLYASEEIAIYVPGKRSQVLKLIEPPN